MKSMHAWKLGAVACGVVMTATAGFAYEATTVTGGGKISGVVRYQGDPPAPAKLAVTKVDVSSSAMIAGPATRAPASMRSRR